MFPISLKFCLEEVKTRSEIEAAARSWFPDLRWGTLDDLMKRGDEWPEAVVCVECNEEADTDEYSTEVDFLVFPRRTANHSPVMVPTKIALMRRLAREFECRVSGDTNLFAIPDDYQRHELLLCKAGRFFSAEISPLAFHHAGIVPPGAWKPVDDIPDAELDPRGRLLNEEATVAAFEQWRIDHWENWEPQPETGDSPSDPPSDNETTDETDETIDFDSPFESDEDDASGESRVAGNWDDVPYLKRVAEWENGFGTTSGKQLIERGISLPPPDSLDDTQLHDKLWEVIHGLAATRHFLHSTNHLSDRELYQYLWTEGMNELTIDMSDLPNGASHMDLIGSGSEEDIVHQHKYYADARERADWLASFPDSVMPAHEDPPHDRDRHLPKADH